MNDRIRELLEQVVRIEVDPDSKCETIYTCEPDDFEVFAELIIQECCLEIAEEAARHSQYGMGVLAISSNSIARIKQRFGINGL